MVDSHDRRDTGTVRILTLNLWSRHGDWPARRAVLIDGLRALAPELIALQETIVTDDYDHVSDLLGSAYHVVHPARRAPDGAGTRSPAGGRSRRCTKSINR